jgi:hypothetical protein
MKLLAIRSLDISDPLPKLGEKIVPPAPLPPEPRDVAPGVFQSADGKMHTEILKNCWAPVDGAEKEIARLRSRAHARRSSVSYDAVDAMAPLVKYMRTVEKEMAENRALTHWPTAAWREYLTLEQPEQFRGKTASQEALADALIAQGKRFVRVAPTWHDAAQADLSKLEERVLAWEPNTAEYGARVEQAKHDDYADTVQLLLQSSGRELTATQKRLIDAAVGLDTPAMTCITPLHKRRELAVGESASWEDVVEGRVVMPIHYRAGPNCEKITRLS